MTFVIFYALNPAFALTEEGESAEKVRENVSSRMGIDPKFLEVVEKKQKNGG